MISLDLHKLWNCLNNGETDSSGFPRQEKNLSSSSKTPQEEENETVSWMDVSDRAVRHH